MSGYEDLDPAARSWVDGLHAQLQTTVREYEERRIEEGLPEPVGKAPAPGTVVTASFVDVVERDGYLGVDVVEHELIWPDRVA